MKQSFLYFVQAVSGGVGIGPVKIGYATDLRKRLRQIQSHCPFALRLLKAVAGGFDFEADLHRQYREWNSHGEWFEATPKLLEHIERLPGAVEIKPQSYRVKPRTKNWSGD